jgi:hypothetical protein
LQCRGYVRVERDTAELTWSGRQWAEEHGFIADARRAALPDLRLCLDWTERRYHLAGSMPSAILHALLEQGHLRRGPQRILHLTASGRAWFAALAAPEAS